MPAGLNDVRVLHVHATSLSCAAVLALLSELCYLLVHDGNGFCFGHKGRQSSLQLLVLFLRSTLGCAANGVASAAVAHNSSKVLLLLLVLA
jgi:hypothetical protein